MAKKGGLGSGLDALFEDNSNENTSVKTTLRISQIERNRLQPRKNFDEKGIETLAESLREHGILQPLVVRPYKETYQLVAGERRFRAAIAAGFEEIPVIIKELNDLQTMQIAIIENIQREDLSPIEEAQAYKELIDKYEMTQETVAKTVGKSRSQVANLLRILNLPNDVKMRIEDGSLSLGHAKILASIDNSSLQSELAAKACDDKMTVRDLEKLVSALAKNNDEEQAAPAKNAEKKVFFREVELNLEQLLGRKIKVQSNSKNQGKLTIEFFDEEDLNYLSTLLEKYNKNSE